MTERAMLLVRGQLRRLARLFLRDDHGTIPGPSDRQYQIDDHTPSLTDWTDLIVGEPDLGGLEEVMTDLTGPGDSAPDIQPSGFTRPKDITIAFKPDVGGTPDPTASFHADRSGSRTITITFASGWTASGEAYIGEVNPGTPVENLSALEVVFKPYGTWTIT